MKKRNDNPNHSILFCLAAIAATAIACGSAPPPKPEEPAYTPRYTYPVQSSGEKIDVTVGLIAPQYGEKAKAAATPVFPGMPALPNPWEDNLGQNFRSGLRSGFNELLAAKGFNVTGPFDSLENMTFPEKKGADFILYPELDVTLSQTFDNKQTRQEGNSWSGYTSVSTCDLVLSMGGDISIVAKEPLSGEKMWIKRVEMSDAGQTFHIEGDACSGLGDLPREAQNAKGRLYQSAFEQVMSALDRYVSGEEFQMLKAQAAELREKKAY